LTFTQIKLLPEPENRSAEPFGKTSEPETSTVDIKTLHAKIGQLTLENDFLERALNKAGLLSARK
jgi:transposase